MNPPDIRRRRPAPALLLSAALAALLSGEVPATRGGMLDASADVR